MNLILPNWIIDGSQSYLMLLWNLLEKGIPIKFKRGEKKKKEENSNLYNYKWYYINTLWNTDKLKLGSHLRLVPTFKNEPIIIDAGMVGWDSIWEMRMVFKSQKKRIQGILIRIWWNTCQTGNVSEFVWLFFCFKPCSSLLGGKELFINNIYIFS